MPVSKAIVVVALSISSCNHKLTSLLAREAMDKIFNLNTLFSKKSSATFRVFDQIHGDCDVPSPIQADRHLSRQIAACERGQAAQKSSVRRGRRSKCAADGKQAALSLGGACSSLSRILGQTKRNLGVLLEELETF